MRQERTMIDAHVHVWPGEFDRFPLAEGFSPEGVEPRAFTPETLLGLGRPAGVRRYVLVQPRCFGTDNAYVLEQIRRHPDTFRGIAVVDHRRPDLLEELGRLSTGGIRGVRVRPAARPAGPWLDEGAYAELFRICAELGLAVCALIEPDGIEDLGRMCAEFPGTSVVVDHMARIGGDAPVDEADMRRLCALAAFGQVEVKVSAFYALGLKRPPHTDLAQPIRMLRDAFGAARLMWGSDCPYQVVSERYEDSLSLVRDRLNFLDGDDRRWILGGTAERTFFGASGHGRG